MQREIGQKVACGHTRTPVALAVSLMALLLAVSGCSQNSSGETPKHTGGASTVAASSAAEVTLRTSSAPAPAIGGTTGSTGATSSTAPVHAKKVTLRIEGDKGVRFSGLCKVGEKETVISGRVPQLFSYTPAGQKLSCRIQKQGGKGTLRVTLIAGNTTRSVQQTNSQNSTIKVSYSGG